MSPVHGNQGQPFGRPAAPSQSTPNNQWGQQQPQAAPQGYGYAPAGQGYAPAPKAPANGQGGYGQHQGYAPQAPQGGGYGAQGYNPGYGGADPYAQQAPASTTGGRAPASYAPQFEPYAPPVAQAAPQRAHPQSQPAYPQQHVQPQGYGNQGYDYGAPAPLQPSAPAYAPQSWNQLQPEPRGFDLGSFNGGQQNFSAPEYSAPEPSFGAPAPQQFGNPQQFGAPQHNEWPQDDYAAEPAFYGRDGGHVPQGLGPAPAEYAPAEYAPADYAPDQQGAEFGFGQAAGGELDQGYVDDEAQEYEAEEPSRWRRPLLMVAVLAGAIFVGGGSMYAYKAVFGGPHAGDPPVVKSAAQPDKVKPEDGGGKQFAHTDSKIMGRLGDGSAAPAADGASSDVDASGTRKVATLVVGRDGTIQAPPSDGAAASPAAVNPAPIVPGLTVVDGLGTSRPPVAAAPPSPPPQAQPAAVAAAAPAAPVKPIKVTKISAPEEPTGSIDPEAAAPAKPKKIKKPVSDAASAAATPASASTSVATTGSGFVAVLASVPRSNSSRMDALKRFADMQQKYASVLSGKTPDVAEANLGTKGSYHRLVVGPPGSREQANSLCSQLKSQGYTDCWVTSY